VRALDGRIRALLKLGRHDEAEQAAREMLALSPQPVVQAFGHNYLGMALLWRGSLMPVVGEGAERTAEIQAEQRRLLERSAEEFRAAVELGGERAAEVRLSLAQALIQLGETAEARKLVTGFLEGGGSPDAAAALSCQLGLAGEREGKPPAHSLLEPGVTPPVKKHAPPPEYTPAAIRARVRGTIYFDLVIDENGRIRCPRILSGLPYGLNEVTLHELRRWRFEPARAGGEAVPVVYSLRVSFSIQ
jgi:TonB family protein